MAEYPSGLRGRIASPLFVGSNPTSAFWGTGRNALLFETSSRSVEPSRLNWLKTLVVANAPPIIVAHRGLHGELPENSLAAMVAAWDAGILWCECDVHLSRDGEAIVIHDETLDRTTTGQGPVGEFSLKQLEELRLRDRTGKPTSHR